MTATLNWVCEDLAIFRGLLSCTLRETSGSLRRGNGAASIRARVGLAVMQKSHGKKAEERK
jgi:hypothetical protein